MMPGLSGRIHPEGFPFIGIAGMITLILWPLSAPAGWISFWITCWCAYFFRDPDRVPPQRDDVIVSPADGLIQAITPASLPSELDHPHGQWVRVSIFLNIFDVHVNRMPIGGRIAKSHYRPGKFFNASLDKASELNERQSLLIQTSSQHYVGCVQIAGLIARRIVCNAKEEDTLELGQRFGLIRFGSRVDLYIPQDCPICVQVGQRAIAGETLIADMKEQTP